MKSIVIKKPYHVEIENIEIVVKVIDDGTYTYTPILVVSVNGHKKCFTGELITIQAIRN